MTTETAPKKPNIKWDKGTAYDLFISLSVLHKPAEFGVRGAWAAGVRSRLPAFARELFESHGGMLTQPPFQWIYTLPEPKDATTALYALKQIPAEERILRVFMPAFEGPGVKEFFQNIVTKRSWEEQDRQTLTLLLKEHKKWGKVPAKKVQNLLDFAAHAEENGDAYLKSMQAYFDVFFSEEEERIRTKLEDALTHAQEQATKLPFAELQAELSHGIRMTDMDDNETIIFVPSYWTTPLVMWGDISPGVVLNTFGARPADDSLVPGEIVPDALLQSLKAMADPTRLRILRYLMQEELTPAELSRRLRLRAPTVTHHLHSLRLAGLVRFTLRGHNERLYSARMTEVTNNYIALKSFLEEDQNEARPIEVLEVGRVR
jgi:DNA-binding transcriptional ArsR family regulator